MNGSSGRRRGFTLVELLAVCLLLTVFAALVMLSVRDRIINTRLTAAVEQLEDADRWAQDQARRTGTPCRIEFSANDRRLRVLCGPRTAKQIQLPRSISIEQVRAGGRTSRDVRRIFVSRRGQSPTYAVALATVNGRRDWILIAGGSGQALRVRTRREINALLRL